MERRAGRWARAASIGLAAVVASGGMALAPAGADGPVRYEPPVEAEVVEPFHVDGGPYSRGNRGLDYGTEPGTEVRAAADGSVTFAGTVAGSRHVTVLHEDGIRTSYSFLDEVRVARGQRVRRGQVVGTTRGELHFGARRGDAYFDPASLFDGLVKVRLVKFDRPPGTGPGGERSALRQLAGGFIGAGKFIAKGGGAAVNLGKDGLGWVGDGTGQLARSAVTTRGRH
ncbi:MAG: M23 family metallopeptidase, partial [Actinomycetota bacterium]|nr:M23 family metallopeptidase [Actinomycetota bacterium]